METSLFSSEPLLGTASHLCLDLFQNDAHDARVKSAQPMRALAQPLVEAHRERRPRGASRRYAAQHRRHLIAEVHLSESVGPSIRLSRSIFSTNLYQRLFYNDLYDPGV